MPKSKRKNKEAEEPNAEEPDPSCQSSFQRKGTENAKLLSQFKNLTINAPEKETSDREQERQILHQLYSKITRKNKNLIQVTYVALAEFIDDVDFDPSMTAYEYFGMIQFAQTVREMRARMVKSILSCEDVRDHMENLYCLYIDFVEVGAYKGARRLAEDVNDLIGTMGDFLERLEQVTEKRVTNWVSVAALLDRFDTQEDTPFSAYVPDISCFLPSESLLGVGGFGSVHKCKLYGGPYTSVKLVRKNRFKSESYSVAGKIVGAFLNSIHLCRSYANFATEDCYISVLEYIDGVDLSKVIKGLSGIPLEYNRVITAQLCMALKYLHYKGFIHRDVKPANMMVTCGNRMKLIDYDTVKICIGKFSTKSQFKNFFKRTSREFCDRRAPGTVMYMPPEVLTGAAYGRALDWWAVGITAYHMHCNCQPFDDAQMPKVKLNIVDKEFEWPTNIEIPADLEELVTEFLVKKPTERLGSESYMEIEKHQFFAPVDWDTWERGFGWMNWPELDAFMLTRPALLKSVQEAKAKKIVLLENQKPASTHAAIYTFFSVGYRRTLDKIRAGQPLTGGELDENLEVLKDRDQPYIFQKYVTRRRKKKPCKWKT